MSVQLVGFVNVRKESILLGCDYSLPQDPVHSRCQLAVAPANKQNGEHQGMLRNTRHAACTTPVPSSCSGEGRVDFIGPFRVMMSNELARSKDFVGALKNVMRS